MDALIARLLALTWMEWGFILGGLSAGTAFLCNSAISARKSKGLDNPWWLVWLAGMASAGALQFDRTKKYAKGGAQPDPSMTERFRAMDAPPSP